MVVVMVVVVIRAPENWLGTDQKWIPGCDGAGGCGKVLVVVVVTAYVKVAVVIVVGAL